MVNIRWIRNVLLRCNRHYGWRRDINGHNAVPNRRMSKEDHHDSLHIDYMDVFGLGSHVVSGCLDQRCAVGNRFGNVCIKCRPVWLGVIAHKRVGKDRPGLGKQYTQQEQSRQFKQRINASKGGLGRRERSQRLLIAQPTGRKA